MVPTRGRIHNKARKHIPSGLEVHPSNVHQTRTDASRASHHVVGVRYVWVRVAREDLS